MYRCPLGNRHDSAGSRAKGNIHGRSLHLRGSGRLEKSGTTFCDAKAQLEVGEGTLKAEVTFFHFGAGSGTTADNVSRWFSQFSGSEANRKTENTEVNGVKITFVETAGTFSSGMPGGPTTPLPDYALRGAILENAEGGDVYVKMTGPETVVKAATPAFKEMVTNAARPAAR